MTAKQLTLLSMIALAALAEANEMPNGHLYAALMAHDVSLDTHNMIVQALKNQGFVTEENFLLTVTPKGKDFGLKVGKALDEAMKS